MRALIVALIALIVCAMPASVSAQETQNFQLEQEPGAPGVVRFWWSPIIRWGETEDTRLSLIAVFTDASASRPPGVAAIRFDQRIDCASQVITSLSYAAYGEDGALIAEADTIPAALTGYVSGDVVQEHWTFICHPPWTMGFSPASPLPRTAPDVPTYRFAPVSTVAAAMQSARAREDVLTVARALPQDGRFVLHAASDQGAMYVDFARRETVGGYTRIEWLFVRRPGPVRRGADPPAAYLRISATVDCGRSRGALTLVAEYDEQDRLVRVSGALPEAAFSEMRTGAFLAEACAASRPPMFSRSYRSVPEVLAAAREAFAAR